MGIYRNLLKDNEKRRIFDMAYSGLDNGVIYGPTGKSSLIAGLSEKVDAPILVLTPAGTSTMLEESYDNFTAYAVNDLKEIETIINDIENDFNRVRTLRRAILSKDNTVVDKAKRALGEEFNEYMKYANDGTFPLACVVLEEAACVSQWIQETVEETLGLEVVGAVKAQQGFDWNLLKRKTLAFYQKLLRLPVPVFICTSSIEADESRKISKRIPSICVGSAQRILIDNIANVFYSYIDNNGEYKVQIVEDEDTYCKNKLLLPKSKKKVDKIIDIHKKPEALWEYIEKNKETKKKVDIKK